ncbi:hypothetical protein BDF20DRAFT_825651, partial [Mycotypha africana]|uniref:uncharacterized protein n=1 Tax=Mycotypha africana TaxID=64632 RepID=UPI0022FFD0F4
YICQRAAEAIIADIGPFRLSNDALQTINLFLDEFLAVLLLTATQLDLVRIKAAVIQLLPHYSLGKNALVEAELELKQQLESSKSINNLQQPPQHDFSTYEKMRSLTIGTVMVYVTAIVEHIAEYLLNAVAMMADRVNADYIKVKEVLYTLIEDPQVGNLFRRMNLKETLEVRRNGKNLYTNRLCSNDQLYLVS